MRLILLTVVAATVVGLIAGGTFRDFPSVKLRWWGLALAGTSLEPLGDVIPLGAPIDQTISIGDICVQLGTAWFIVFAMPRRRQKIAEPETAAT